LLKGIADVVITDVVITDRLRKGGLPVAESSGGKLKMPDNPARSLFVLP
jgi:hypothetical protein